MSDDLRPNFQIVRCCLNCSFYKPGDTQDKINALRGAGVCSVNKTIDEKAKPLYTHATLVCDAHVWRQYAAYIQKIIKKYNVNPPKDLV